MLLISLCKPLFAADIKIISLNPPLYTATGTEDVSLKQACNDWKITPDDVITLFNLSQKYSQQEILQGFYWLPCQITGKLEHNGTEWDFVINAAATAIWKNSQEVIYWGCTKAACEKMFLLPYDGMQ